MKRLSSIERKKRAIERKFELFSCEEVIAFFEEARKRFSKNLLADSPSDREISWIYRMNIPGTEKAQMKLVLGGE